MLSGTYCMRFSCHSAHICSHDCSIHESQIASSIYNTVRMDAHQNVYLSSVFLPFFIHFFSVYIPGIFGTVSVLLYKSVLLPSHNKFCIYDIRRQSIPSMDMCRYYYVLIFLHVRATDHTFLSFRTYYSPYFIGAPRRPFTKLFQSIVFFPAGCTHVISKELSLTRVSKIFTSTPLIFVRPAPNARI